MNKKMISYNRRSLVYIILATFSILAAWTQNFDPMEPVELEHKDIPTLDGRNLIYTDTLGHIAETQTYVKKDTILDPLRVVTNRFGKNWFLFGTVGGHTFHGDYSKIGKFSGTLSADWSVGVGKWFTPGVGLKVEFIRSNSRGYTEYLTGHYGYGDIMLQPDGTPYRKMKTGWWDISGNVILNLTRLFNGYEGINSKKHMNQIMANIGIGGVHHLGYEHQHGSDNEWSGHIELQYSRFFTPGKRWSLDIKARGIFYQTNFDLEYGQANHAAGKWDFNAGVDIGFTLYLGKKRANGWGSSTVAYYQRDFRQRDVLTIYDSPANTVDYGTITFYAFYPNNYSGRDDAPQHEDVVNAIDYLVGGIDAQKRYVDSNQVKERLAAGVPLRGLEFEDIPTEKANQNFSIDFVPRGYEMLTDVPMSLSLEPADMNSFYEKVGYYYAPIYDGLHQWSYRIDEATYRQKLLSDENYYETKTFGLNGHAGLETVRANMNVSGNEELVSLADIYAAMTSNEGYVSQFTDSATVERINHIINSGIITLIQVEGTATSQDNFTGANAKEVGIERNTALSNNRANTVISWLKENPKLEEVSSQIYLVNDLHGVINRVDDPSTRGLNAKLNRCVKVKIHYMIP